VVGVLLASALSGRPKQRPEPPQEKPVPAEETARVPKEKTEIPKVGPEGPNIFDINSKRDLKAQALEASGSSTVESLTKDSFIQKVFDYEQNKEWEFEGKLPCIVDFYADWCGPCKMVEPILQELAQEYQGKLNIYRVDTQDQQELAATFGIQSIPSILFVPLDDQPKMAVGALPKEALKKAINEVLEVE
jgi:thioredoxin 1